MKFMWTFIDGVITAPAWMLGYLYAAYHSTFNQGRKAYADNIKKYWLWSRS